MPGGPVEWLDSKPFAIQLVILVAVLDPVGAFLGYTLQPQLGVNVWLAMSVGLVASSSLLGLWILRYVLQQR